jgi:hypothetical protein
MATTTPSPVHAARRLTELAERIGLSDLLVDARTGADAARLARSAGRSPQVDRLSRLLADPAVADVVRTRALGHLAVAVTRTLETGHGDAAPAPCWAA